MKGNFPNAQACIDFIDLHIGDLRSQTNFSNLHKCRCVSVCLCSSLVCAVFFCIMVSPSVRVILLVLRSSDVCCFVLCLVVVVVVVFCCVCVSVFVFSFGRGGRWVVVHA